MQENILPTKANFDVGSICPGLFEEGLRAVDKKRNVLIC